MKLSNEWNLILKLNYIINKPSDLLLIYKKQINKKLLLSTLSKLHMQMYIIILQIKIDLHKNNLFQNFNIYSYTYFGTKKPIIF